MDKNDRKTLTIAEYLKDCIVPWVDREMLEMHFTGYEIDLAVRDHLLEPLAPGTIIDGEVDDPSSTFEVHATDCTYRICGRLINVK